MWLGGQRSAPQRAVDIQRLAQWRRLLGFTVEPFTTNLRELAHATLAEIVDAWCQVCVFMMFIAEYASLLANHPMRCRVFGIWAWFVASQPMIDQPMLAQGLDHPGFDGGGS
jgi:hypothetical protein